MSTRLKIGIVGPESTGKSTLAKSLATYYHALWVEEYARAYLEKQPPPYTQADLLTIARKQMQTEKDAWDKTTHILFCDTTLLVLKIWSEQKYGHTPPWIETQLHKHAYDHYLLTAIDIPWTPDPLREHPNEADRGYLFRRYEAYLQQQHTPYLCLRGAHSTRMQQATTYLDKFLSAALQQSSC